MMPIFADTSFYVTLIGKDREERATYLQIMKDPQRKILTTEYILLELGAFFSAQKHRHLFHKLWDLIHSDPYTSIVPASTELLLKGYHYFLLHDDKDWSLTVCVSFVVMREHNIDLVFSLDHHFAQAGFTLVK